MLGLSFVPKYLSIEQAILTDITRPEVLAYKSTDEKIDLLTTINNIVSKYNENAMKYSKVAQDFTRNSSTTKTNYGCNPTSTL